MLYVFGYTIDRSNNKKSNAPKKASRDRLDFVCPQRETSAIESGARFLCCGLVFIWCSLGSLTKIFCERRASLQSRASSAGMIAFEWQFKPKLAGDRDHARFYLPNINTQQTQQQRVQLTGIEASGEKKTKCIMDNMWNKTTEIEFMSTLLCVWCVIHHQGFGCVFNYTCWSGAV